MTFGAYGTCADPEGEAGDLDPHPRKNRKIIGYLSITGPESLKIHKATKPAFIVGPSSARQRNASWNALRWRADDGPILAVSGSTH